MFKVERQLQDMSAANGEDQQVVGFNPLDFEYGLYACSPLIAGRQSRADTNKGQLESTGNLVTFEKRFTQQTVLLLRTEA